MKRFVKCLLLPAVVIAGMIVIGADTAEARRRGRRSAAPVVVVPHHYYHYPSPYRHPPTVRTVYTPSIRVNASPWGPFYTYGYTSTVVAPGVYLGW